MTRRLRILAALSSLALMGAGPADDGRWYAGDYSFSDEMGGFRIVSLSGTGTKVDPIRIEEELHSAEPVTLVIRAALPSRLKTAVQSSMHLHVTALNQSGLAWIGFEFELQEIRGKPSGFDDGLSFGQTNPDPRLYSSDRFAHFANQFERVDRLRFDDGHADPLSRTGLSLFVTDVTPVAEFYLLQDPMVPDS